MAIIDVEFRNKNEKNSMLRKKNSIRDVELRIRSKKKCCKEII
jgi:hypothetical protein